MTRSGQQTKDLIREKATEHFFEKGYAATNLREIAASAGLKPASLYNHIESKEDLLLQVMGGVIDDLMDAQQEAIAQDGDPVEKLRAAIEVHIRFHATRASEVHIGNSNLNSLTGSARNAITAKRASYSNILEQLITDAGEAGLAEIIDARLHAYSITAQGAHIAGWYRPEGRLPLDDIVKFYSKILLREIKVQDADERVERAAADESLPT